LKQEIHHSKFGVQVYNFTRNYTNKNPEILLFIPQMLALPEFLFDFRHFRLILQRYQIFFPKKRLFGYKEGRRERAQ